MGRRRYLKEWLAAFKDGRIKFRVVGDGMVTWQWVKKDN